MYYVILKPSTMEDAGRSTVVGSHSTEQAANNQIEKLVQESKGYYSFGSFTIVKPQNEF